MLGFVGRIHTWIKGGLYPIEVTVRFPVCFFFPGFHLNRNYTHVAREVTSSSDIQSFCGFELPYSFAHLSYTWFYYTVYF